MDDHERVIVCICGSMRFFDEMLRAAMEETWNLKVVLMPFVSKDTMTEDEAWRIDLLHSYKIEMAHELLVIDCTWETCSEPYIGSSTALEVKFANERGKPVRFRHDEYAKGLVVGP